ncbi:TonB family protein [Pontibacter ummariensis]
MHYPAASAKRGVQGVVLLPFLIDRVGSITDLRVVQGVRRWMQRL